MNDVKDRFLVNSDHTGKFVVTSKLTGITYFVEPFGKNVTGWGDAVPGSGVNQKMTGKYGKKYRGAVDKDKCVVTEANGFENVTTLQPGQSPLKYIDRIDQLRFASMCA